MKVINGIKLFSSKEVLQLLGIRSPTLTSLRKRGLIRSVQIGKGLYTSEQSLNDYLNGYTKALEMKRELKELREQGKVDDNV